MKIRLTESQLNRIIEDNIRRVLSEKDDGDTKKQLRQALAAPALNRGPLADKLASREGVSSDDMRSRLSKYARGKKPIPDDIQGALYKGLSDLGADV